MDKYHNHITWYTICFKSSVRSKLGFYYEECEQNVFFYFTFFVTMWSQFWWLLLNTRIVYCKLLSTFFNISYYHDVYNEYHNALNNTVKTYRMTTCRVNNKSCFEWFFKMERLENIQIGKYTDFFVIFRNA